MARRLIAVVGPTASGKSALALELAQRIGGEIVSCDSLQVYRGCDVGSAKPTREELARVPHHVIDVVDPDQPFNAADWVRHCRAALDAVRVPIVCGGTGLYLRALLHGLFEAPTIDAALRARIARWRARFGAPRLHRLLTRLDPAAAARIQPNDPIRVERALEVRFATGQPISALQPTAQPLTGWDVKIVGLDPGREALRERVERRTDDMLARGLVDEVRRLRDRYGEPIKPLQAIGYRQALQVVRGELDEPSARRDIVTGTLQYAKRQRTWFRHQATVEWHADPAPALASAQAWLQEALPS